ncbi:MAG: restriction endonuclease subunit S [Microcystis flos-aquae Mf_WU_F_19750830_S460]|uniref:Restriction endonuclease subunit S n=3 Tax=Microcystis TaxID=1125 RepID=A0A552LX40_9CHRO|nr:MAG: restriction endonuclease subunit S [Microcystis flos-aquae Mf_WU_F_19750830_S460]
MSWTEVTLVDVCKPKQWKTIPISALKKEGYPVYGANGVIGFYDEFNHLEETLMITCRGATCGTINLSTPKSYITGNAMALDDLDRELCDIKFLYYYLSNRGFNDAITGTAQPQITRTSLSGIKIPLPPLEEQRRIAAILDKADGVRRKRKEAIRLTEELLKSTFLEMFGYSSDESVSIGELLDKGVLLLHKDGNHGSNYPRTSEFGIEGIPFLSANCFSDSGEMITDNVKFLSESKANKLKIGWLEPSDVLLAHNATVGRVALYDGRYKQALVGTSLTIFRPHREYLLPEFLFGVLRSEMFQKQLAHNMEQSTRNQVPITAQRDLKIKLASLKKQLKFKELFHHVMNISKKYESSNQESENLFNSLLQRAFRGEL